MAWDFETEPEFEEQLAWMRAFIDRELIPLEPIFDELPADEWKVVKAHLQDQVKAQGLWGAFLDPKLGGQGLGQLKLALMSEIIGRCMMSMTIFGVQAPDSGNMELLAHGATDAQKERWLWPNLRGEISSAFALTEPFLAGSDPTVIGTTAVKDGDEWVINGHKWFITNASVADIVLVFAETNPGGPAPPPRLGVRGSRRDPGHGDRPRHQHHGPPRRRVRAGRQPRRDRVPRLPRAGRPPDRTARRRVRPGPAAARRGPDPPRHALAGPGPTVARHHVRAGRVATLPRPAPRPSTR